MFETDPEMLSLIGRRSRICSNVRVFASIRFEGDLV